MNVAAPPALKSEHFAFSGLQSKGDALQGPVAGCATGWEKGLCEMRVEFG